MSRDTNAPILLLIEDEEEFLEELEEEFLGKGYTVVTASSAERADDVIAMVTPDIVVCDVMLPGKGGFDLLTEWRRLGKLSDQTAFLFLTALSERAPQLIGLKAGANDYLCKPVDLDILHLKIANLLKLVHGKDRVDQPANSSSIHLSPREREVLALLAMGARTSEIAFKLDISEHTVNQYIKEIYKKLRLGNRADAARAAIAMGLVRM